MSTLVQTTTATPAGLSPTRLNVMRAAYLLVGLGLAVTRWPRLPDAHTLPLYEGVTLCLLTALSALALLGLRHPVRMLPLLLLETLWKLIWLLLVALPKALAADLDAATSETVVNCSLVVLVMAAVPWRYVWQQHGRAAGGRWR